MAALPRHGTTRRYKAGCHCDRCTAKNTADKERERAAKIARDGRVPTARVRVPTKKNVPTFKAPDDPDVPTPGPIETAARDALAEFDADKVVVLRREIAIAIARTMDGKAGVTPSQFQIFRTALVDLLGERAPKDGELDAIRNLVESIGSSRKRGHPAPVDNAAQPGP
ncbi:hypothetical protein QN357_01505 [Cryobacterium sp. RTC2.1]|uniref:hypothetical protein n=1 Tax=Cryobacterium sp. RTC2.1 TaxID=3048634 RepID=UPI002B2388EA|nr:hypothetical protein [Cryobacterium sp. RTC2.1]MEB0001612.1 hypothetical protein [Cryobacterium sp. RTC2.1]